MLHYCTTSGISFYIFSELPYNDYFEYYGPDFKLHISPSNMANQNTTEYLDKIKTRLFENLRMLPHAPGVQMQGKECCHKCWSDLGDKQYQREYRILEMCVKPGLHKFF